MPRAIDYRAFSPNVLCATNTAKPYQRVAKKKVAHNEQPLF